MPKDDQGVLGRANGPVNRTVLLPGDPGEKRKPFVGVFCGVRDGNAEGAVADVPVVEMLGEGRPVPWAERGQTKLPIWPLDGGQISREIFQAIWKVRGLLYSLLLSGIVAAVVALHCLMAASGRVLIPYLEILGGTFNALFFALFAVNSFQLWAAENEQLNASPGYEDDQLPWE